MEFWPPTGSHELPGQQQSTPLPTETHGTIISRRTAMTPATLGVIK